MLKLGFGKRFRHRQFEYIPRYYDPVKEELKNRLRVYEETEESEKDPEVIKERIRSGLRMKYRGDGEFRAKLVQQSNVRLVVIIVILCLISYLILNADVFYRMLRVFSSESQ
jgi:hypothetical protein